MTNERRRRTAADAMTVVISEIARADPLHSAGVDALRQNFGARLKVLDVPPRSSGPQIRQAYARADILVTRRLAKDAPPIPNAGLLQVPASGFDLIEFARLPPGCRVCNLTEHGVGVGEFALAAMLEWTIGLGTKAHDFKAGSWSHGSAVNAPPHGELYGRTAAIFGFGHIGAAVATRSRAFGMRIEALTRDPSRCGSLVDRAYGPDGLAEFIDRADFLILACPLTEATRGLVDGPFLGRMKNTSVLINLARAEVIHEDALFEALQSRTIGGAILDVWWSYPSAEDPNPRPAARPFHELDTVMMTSHIASWTQGLVVRRWDAIARNIESYLSGVSLENCVFCAPTANPTR